MPTSIDVFAKAREHERLEQLRAARELDALPYFRVLEGPTLPVVEMEGRRRIMLGSNNYLGLTGDERVKQGALDALDRYGTGLTGSRFLNGTIDLHLELERELAEWLDTEAALVFTTGHQANLGALGTILGPGDTVIADSGDHASILDGCILSRAKLQAVPAQPLDRLERTLEKAAGDGGGVLVVVDGVFSMEGDVAPLPEIVELCRRFGARLMVDEAHALGVLGARGAGTAELFGVEDRGRPADGHLLEVAGLLRRRDRRPGRRDRVPADPVAAVHVHRLGGARQRSARRSPRSASAARTRAASCSPACSTTPATCTAGSASSDSRSSSRRGWQTAPRSSHRSFRSWSATTGRPCSCGRRSTRPACSSTSAIHPAVPPAGALLRTSVMATHDHATLDQALELFGGRQAGVRVRARIASRPLNHRPVHTPPVCPDRAQVARRNKKYALSAWSARCDVAVTGPLS